MRSDDPVPAWLWRTATYGFGLALIGILALALALAAGFADPPHAGPLWLSEDFKDEVEGWQFITLSGGNVSPREGALWADFTGPDQTAFGVTAQPPSENFSVEVAGTQTAGATGTAYGLVFAWQDERHYSAVLVNGNGYAQAYRQAGAERTEWFEWQQWPHVLGDTNRVRIDRRGAQVTVRINDEKLIEVAAEENGKVGMMARTARSAGQSRVVFSWVKVWAAPFP
ncbi:MAG: hypothetical protein ACRDH2_11760 [Anaerolineales bacterium]